METIEVGSPEDDFLFLDFINELVFLTATKGLLFSKFEIRIREDQLTAQGWGEPLDLERHEPAVEIKAASMNELKVARRNDGTWVAQCVVDV
jgi:SHS2 domain-containing protein